MTLPGSHNTLRWMCWVRSHCCTSVKLTLQAKKNREQVCALGQDFSCLQQLAKEQSSDPMDETTAVAPAPLVQKRSADEDSEYDSEPTDLDNVEQVKAEVYRGHNQEVTLQHGMRTIQARRQLSDTQPAKTGKQSDVGLPLGATVRKHSMS